MTLVLMAWYIGSSPMQLPEPDLHHRRATEGRLKLGSHLEVDAELDRITPTPGAETG